MTHISSTPRVSVKYPTAPAPTLSDDALRALATHGLCGSRGLLSGIDRDAINATIREICTELLAYRAIDRDAAPMITDAPKAPKSDMSVGMLEHLCDQHATMEAQVGEMTNLVRGIHAMLGGPQAATGG
ncbi:MAG: hypothetical protein AAFY75_04120 [Pseudomonadota bacterium]